MGWYGIAYILALVSTILIFGQLYTFYPMKAIFISSFAVFALGSAVIGLATSSAMFILGFGLFAHEISQTPEDIPAPSLLSFWELVLYFGTVGLASVFS